MKKLEKLFSNSKVMITFGILSAILYIAAFVPNLFDNANPQYKLDFIPSAMFGIVIIYLLVAFKKGETNIQKALIGALLFYFAQSSFNEGFFALEDAAYALWDGATYYGALYMIVGIFEYAIFFTHIALQSDHIGGKGLVTLNQLSCFVVLFVYIFDIFYQCINVGFVFDTLYVLTDLAEALFIITIVCMETKIQNYKNARALAMENGTWTAQAKSEAKEIFKK